MGIFDRLRRNKKEQALESKRMRPEPVDNEIARSSDASGMEKYTNSIGIEFLLIPAGQSNMGSFMSPKELISQVLSEGLSEYHNEIPLHTIKIESPFYLQTTPVTQGQWKRVMGDNPSHFEDCGDECPVEQVSWNDAKQFINKLNQMEKTSGYHLPSEAEWEYACRTGSKTKLFFGNDEKKLGEFAWYKENSEDKTHPVGKKKPNGWGLYDMYGNVWEWVEDDWHDRYEGAPTDGQPWVDSPRGSLRVMRGGSWVNEGKFCRSAIRIYSDPDKRKTKTIGFRLSMSVSGKMRIDSLTFIDSALIVKCLGVYGVGSEGNPSARLLAESIEKWLLSHPEEHVKKFVIDYTDVDYSWGDGPVSSMIPFIKRGATEVRLIAGLRNREPLKELVRASNFPRFVVEESDA